jgi:hypothetical protein
MFRSAQRELGIKSEDLDKVQRLLNSKTAGFFLQKSYAYPQKSSIFPQKSSVYPQMGKQRTWIK